MRLNEIQKNFKNMLLDLSEKAPEGFSDLFHPGSIGLSERLGIYRNNIFSGLRDLLAASFPLLEKLTGRTFLDSAAYAFIAENPPQEGCLNIYGHGFDAFIAGFAPAAHLPYLADVAAFEIALNESYYAADDRPLRAADLAAISPDHLPDMKLALRDSIRLVSSRFPLTAIRNFCLKKEREEGETLDLDQGGVWLMVCRPGIEVLIVTLDGPEFLMLENLQQGCRLGEALEKILNTYGDFDMAAFLKKHLDLESFVALASPRTMHRE